MNQYYLLLRVIRDYYGLSKNSSPGEGLCIVSGLVPCFIQGLELPAMGFSPENGR